MSLAETRWEQMFPCLSDAEIAAAERFALVAPRRFESGKILFALGSHETAAWLVLEGGFDLVRRLPLGEEVPIASLVRGYFSGEIGQWSGGATLALGRAGWLHRATFCNRS